MSQTLTPDLCVIGAGSGGLALTAAARTLGADVVVIERGRMGGTRLENGALASRALVEASRHAHAMRTGRAFGLAEVEPDTNYARVRDHVRAAVAAVAPNLSAERVRALGADLIVGEARFANPRTVIVGDTLVRARRFVIATGSVPTLPPIAGLDTVPFFTSETIFENARKITHLVIVGAGAIGAELGQAFRRLGADVTLIEAATPLPDADPELAVLALRRMQDEGVLIRTATTVPQVAPREAGGVVVTISANGVEETISASHLLVATGRLPNLDLDLDKAGIARDPADPMRLRLTPHLRTTNRRVYALGDATGAGSTQSAIAQAHGLARSLLLGLPTSNQAKRTPTATYTDPQIAWVGLSEAQARQRHKSRFRVLRQPFAANDRARAQGESGGLCKLILAPNGRILGAGIVGPDAGELIGFFALANANGLDTRHLARMVPPYPTLAGLIHDLGVEAERGRPRPWWTRALIGLNRQLP